MFDDIRRKTIFASVAMGWLISTGPVVSLELRATSATSTPSQSTQAKTRGPKENAVAEGLVRQSTMATVAPPIYGCAGPRASGESMVSGWWCTITCQPRQTSSVAKLF